MRPPCSYNYRTRDFHGFFKKRIALESPSSPHFPNYRCAENDIRRNTRVPIESSVITSTSKMNRACKQGAVSTERRARRRVVVSCTKNSDEARVKTPSWRRRYLRDSSLVLCRRSNLSMKKRPFLRNCNDGIETPGPVNASRPKCIGSLAV